MSVLIKGLEMPKGSAAVSVKIWADGAVEIIDQDGEWTTTEAVPVPRHGRLIDADALHFVQEFEEPDPLDFIRRYAIEKAPSVIEAEEG